MVTNFDKLKKKLFLLATLAIFKGLAYLACICGNFTYIFAGGGLLSKGSRNFFLTPSSVVNSIFVQ